MKDREGQKEPLTPTEGWLAIQNTLDSSRSAMYLAGWPTIALLWGVIVAAGYLSHYAVETFAAPFAEDYPWFPGALWGGLGFVGMVASSVIGYRASRTNAIGRTAASVGLRVFFFWMSVVAAAFIVPAASGMWTSDTDADAIRGVAIGIVALGYILFGILHHAAIALVGVGIAGAFYAPTHFAGDAAFVVSAVLMLMVVVAAWVWFRKSVGA